MTYAIRHHKPLYHLPHGTVALDNLQSAHTSLVATTAQAIWLGTGLLIELLSLRFMIAFLGANPSNNFFHIVYSTSQPFVTPFLNAAHKTYPSGNFYRFELYTLVSIAFYALIGYGITKALTSHKTTH